MKEYRIILSGGGTGGHIYPAVAVAEALKRKLGDRVTLLFVGAEGKMEMEKIPSLGYDIKGLPVAGLQRKLSLSNLKLPLKIARSVRRAREIIRDFKPDVVAGFGGYASGPVLWSAQRLGIPTLTQEQNSYAGLTNKLLARRAKRICVAYDGMERFFPAHKIVFTGNPMRGSFAGMESRRAEALEHFGLQADKPVMLIVGGSLGTRTLNEMMKRHIDDIVTRGHMQVIWQTGKYYEREIDAFMEARRQGADSENEKHTHVWRGAFIERMDYAYAAADVVVSRSGANTVSELCLVGKPAIFVPSPNVTEDHQTKNARALVAKDAAVMVRDAEAVEHVMAEAAALLDNPERMQQLARNMKSLGIPDSAARIADMIIELVVND